MELSTINGAHSLLEKLHNILTKADSLYSNHTAENSKSRVTENNQAEIFNSANGVVL
jgi:archaellum component FlaC